MTLTREEVRDTSMSAAATSGPLRDSASRTREAMVAATQFFRQVDERTARAAGMTAVEARTLRAVDLVGLTQGITAVGSVTGVQQPAATASVRRLEERKFVRRAKRAERVEDTGGAHAALILTESGRQRLTTLEALEDAAFGAVLGAMSRREDRKMLTDLLFSFSLAAAASRESSMAAAASGEKPAGAILPTLSGDPTTRIREAMVAATQCFRRVDERVARAAGMTAVEARTLRAVDVVGLTRGITAVGWSTGVQQPAATASVRRLEQRGFVRRAAKSGQARAAHAALTLTQSGREKLNALQSLEGKAFRKVLGAMTPRESGAVLVELLEKCVASKLGVVERALAETVG